MGTDNLGKWDFPLEYKPTVSRNKDLKHYTIIGGIGIMPTINP